MAECWKPQPPAEAAEWRTALDRRLDQIGLAPLRRLEIIEEIDAFVEARFQELRGSGHSETEARGLAHADLQLEQLARELARIERPAPAAPPPLGSSRSTPMNALSDLKYAFRAIRTAPAFNAVVIATLALGIGANAAIFSVADAVMLRPYAYPDLDRIIVLNERSRSGQAMSVAWPTFNDWRDQNQVFMHLGIYRSTVANLTGADRPERLNAAIASSDVFRALGIEPATGRVFTTAEDRPGAAQVAVISERLWRLRFDSEQRILGRTIHLNNEAHTVVGVMPAAMRFPSRLTDVWLPLGPVVPSLPTSRGAHPGLYAVGKLKPEVTFERAVADMDTIARRLESQFPESNRDVAVEMTPYYEQIVRGIRPTLLLMLGAVGFVLLIACANLANLMLARSERRQHELAVRRALGADRWRIVQQLLTESLVLAVIGGGLGIVLAAWLVQLFVASQPVTIPRIDLVRVDWRVVAFSILVSAVTGILFGLMPALRASNPDLRASLNESGRGALIAPGRRLRSALVVVEVALALMLLVGAGLMIRSFARVMAIEPGFDARNVVTMRLTLPPAKYADIDSWRALHARLVERVAALPGVSAAAVNSAIPLEGGGSEAGVRVEGRAPLAQGSPGQTCLFQAGSPDYFRVMGITLVKGRGFAATDIPTSPRVAVVDETFVQTLFPQEDPIGKRISFEATSDQNNPVRVWREIVGVVRHVRHYGLVQGPPYVQVYTPIEQLPVWFERRRPAMALIASTAIAPESLTASVRQELSALDPDLPVYGVQTMTQYLSNHTEQPRLNVMLLGGLGLLAVLLAAVGIYGVVSYSVAQRTQEIGVRMALGATRPDVMRLVVGESTRMVALGVGLGIAGALALTSFLRTLLFQISERDPLTFVAVAAILAAVGILASVVPARRATRVDPITAMRAQ